MPNPKRTPRKRRATRLTVVEGGTVTDRTSRKAKQIVTDYRAALRDKPIEEVMCRGMKHAWVKYGHSHLINPATKRDLPIVRVDLICERGGHDHPLRHETLVVKKIPGAKDEYQVIERVRATYSYPPGYQMRGVVRGAKPLATTWEELLRRESAMAVYADEPKQTRKDRA